MCRYTRIVWNSCDHSALSSSPEHTLLCSYATASKLRQGVHCAPASCFPLRDDLENLSEDNYNGAIVHTNAVFDFCDACKENLDTEATLPESNVPLVEEYGEYSDDDAQQLAIQRDCLLACEQESLAAMQAFATLATNRASHLESALEVIRNQYIRDTLLSPATTSFDVLFIRSFCACNQLLQTLHLYTTLRVPTPLFSALFGLVGTKVQQAAKRLRTFSKLTDCLDKYEPETKTYEASINKYADKLAVGLGRPDIPDVHAFTHLLQDVPAYVQRAIETGGYVRRWNVRECESVVLRTYKPRASFAAGRIGKGLSVDTKASNLPPGSRDMPRLRNAGDVLEVLYVEGLETRPSLGPMGVGPGPWGIGGVLEQHEGLTLVSHEQTAQLLQSGSQASPASGETVMQNGHTETDQALPEDATFFGQMLSDSDSEVSDYHGDTEARSNVSEDHRKDSTLTAEEKKTWKRDSDGEMSKKRKCSG